MLADKTLTDINKKIVSIDYGFKTSSVGVVQNNFKRD